MGCGMSKASPEKELIEAGKRGDTNKVSSLLKAGTNVNCRDRRGDTALILAAVYGHKATVELLLEHKADIEAKNKDGWTALIVAAGNGRTATVQLLLQHKADIEAKNNDGDTGLILASERGHTATVELLLEHKADIEAKDRVGEAALILAARFGHKATVELLLEHKADIEAKDEFGMTALQWAIDKNKSEVVEVLEAAAAAKREREAAEAEAKRQAEEAAVAAIAGLDDLMASLGIKDQAPAAAEWFQILDLQSVQGLKADGAAKLAQYLKLPADKALALVKTITDAETANIVGDDYEAIYEAFKASLAAAPRSKVSKMCGKLNELKSGKFEDAANGLLPFLKVPENWKQDEACSIQGMEEEVRRLTDCPDCAQIHAKLLKELKREVESEITQRLAGVLAQLMDARRRQDAAQVSDLQDQVQKIRAEIEAIDGWFYGRKKVAAVAWPAESVEHQWGKYGQPLCNGCKKYSLDHSTISADLNYVLYEASSEKECFNGIRDKGRNHKGKDGGGMRLDDFMELKEAVETKLTRAMVAALRFYTSHSFTAINQALRDSDRQTQHPLSGITLNIQEGLKKMRALDAKGAAAVAEVILWRGFTDMEVSQAFKEGGGSEFAPMSTTTEAAVAVGYAIRKGVENGALLMRLKTSNNLQRGAELAWLSVFPGEKEVLYPSLTFIQATGREQEIELDRVKLTVIEATTTLP